eukprot:7712-Heterococcus_DN1.PRE.1
MSSSFSEAYTTNNHVEHRLPTSEGSSSGGGGIRLGASNLHGSRDLATATESVWIEKLIARQAVAHPGKRDSMSHGYTFVYRGFCTTSSTDTANTRFLQPYRSGHQEREILSLWIHRVSSEGTAPHTAQCSSVTLLGSSNRGTSTRK